MENKNEIVKTKQKIISDIKFNSFFEYVKYGINPLDSIIILVYIFELYSQRRYFLEITIIMIFILFITKYAKFIRMKKIKIAFLDNLMDVKNNFLNGKLVFYETINKIEAESNNLKIYHTNISNNKNLTKIYNLKLEDKNKIISFLKDINPNIIFKNIKK